MSIRHSQWPLGAMIIFLAMALGDPAWGATIAVKPGDSIQHAVDIANPGDTVMISAGTYHESGRQCPTMPAETCAVVVTKDDIKLMGKGPGPAVLENAGGQQRGIEVARSGAAGSTCLTDATERISGAVIQGLTVSGFDDSGILLICADNWLVQNCTANGNNVYGIFPSHCGAGRVTESSASGANDTGIYIGQSHDVRIDHNSATDNVSGFEIENSSRVELDHNSAFGNTGGILTFTVPFADVKTNTLNNIHHNDSTANNRPNTCLDPEDSVCMVPPGTGLLVVAADQNEIAHNNVTGNNTFGIAVANFCVLAEPICAFIDIDPFSDGNVIDHNVATGNGLAPALPPAIPPPFAVDLAWDGTGVGNCWDKNKHGTEFLSPLPGCP